MSGCRNVGNRFFLSLYQEYPFFMKKILFLLAVAALIAGCSAPAPEGALKHATPESMG